MGCWQSSQKKKKKYHRHSRPERWRDVGPRFSDPADVYDLLMAFLEPGITPEEVDYFYNQWASTYDEDMALIGYTLPRHGAIFTAKMLGEDKKDARILDAGGGTGLGGIELQKLGFYNLDILDMNTSMLEEAQRKNCYRNITWDYLGKNRLPLAEDSYDAVVIFGAMGGGHANEDCLDEIVRIVRPGGYFVIVMLQCYLPTVPDLEYRLHKMESRGAWTSSLRAVVPDFRQGEAGIVFGLEISPTKYDYMAKWTFR